jgi:hypothetical protein
MVGRSSSSTGERSPVDFLRAAVVCSSLVAQTSLSQPSSALSIEAGVYFRQSFDGSYDDFVGFARRAIIGPQIKARVRRFDPSQFQRPSASGTRRPEIIDKLKIKRVRHGDFSATFAAISAGLKYRAGTLPSI